MKKLDFDFNPLETIKEICPECIFKPKYPYKFQFELILDSKNYGKIEITTEKGLEISVLTGHKEALAKISEIGKEFEEYLLDTQTGYPPVFITYPLQEIRQLYFVLREKNIKTNGDYELIKKLTFNMWSPVDTQLLYEKTGIEMIYG